MFVNLVAGLVIMALAMELAVTSAVTTGMKELAVMTVLAPEWLVQIMALVYVQIITQEKTAMSALLAVSMVIAIGVALPAAATQDIQGSSVKQILMSVLAVLVSMVCVWITMTATTAIVSPVFLEDLVKQISTTVLTNRGIQLTNTVRMAQFVWTVCNHTAVCVVMVLVERIVNSSLSSVSQTLAYMVGLALLWPESMVTPVSALMAIQEQTAKLL